MHFPKVLEMHGATASRLREIYTSKQPEALKENATDEDKKAHECACKNYEIRKRHESRGWSRILAGIEENARHSRVWQAVDMAMDAAPIQKETFPLLLWAQGKIQVERLATMLTDSVGAENAKKFVKKDGNGKLSLDLPRICKIDINIVRSYATRRLAAMDALWANLYPLFKYSPRGMSTIAQLKGDIVTQRIDQMADQYGLRHQGSQWRRDMLMYGTSVVFARSAWDRKVGWRFKKTNDGSEPKETESYVTREGVDLINIHPSRRYFDSSAPLAQINTDNGPGWIGYWDILRWGAVKDCEASYYNLDQVVASSDWTTLAGRYPEFFGFYFDPCVLKWPDQRQNVTRWNDRSEMVGTYANDQRDQGVLLVQHFEKINPKAEGICDYDSEIWVRQVFAGCGTIVGAEFMPSIPACYGAIDVNDSRVLNQSMCSLLLPYQDQLTNIVTHMIEQLRASFTLLYLIDKDSLDAAIVKDLEENATNQNYWLDPKVLIYSGTKLKELGIQDPRQAFSVVRVEITNVVGSALSAISQLLNLADRLMILSPNELGQPNPREVAAREVQEISTSVQAIYSFINQGPREQIAAVKELLFDSLVTMGSPIVRVPVMRKYTLKTIKDAGYKVIDTEVAGDDEYVPVEAPIEGPLSELVYDYYFDSREGSERAVNTQGAQVLMQMLQVITQTPGVVQKLGLDRLLDIVNAIIRMCGAPIDLQIESNDGESDEIPNPEEQAAQQQAQMQAAQQGSQNQAQTQTEMRLQRLESMLSNFMSKMGEGPSTVGSAAPQGAPVLAMSPQMTAPAA